MKGFIQFIREQGVIKLAVAFILGSAITKMVTAFVNDLINPIVGILLGKVGELRGAYLRIGSAKILWGDFINSAIDFTVVSLIVYLLVRGLGLEKLDVRKIDITEDKKPSRKKKK